MAINATQGIVNVYVELIQKGIKTIDDVPTVVHSGVKQALIDLGYSELAE